MINYSEENGVPDSLGWIWFGWVCQVKAIIVTWQQRAFAILEMFSNQQCHNWYRLPCYSWLIGSGGKKEHLFTGIVHKNVRSTYFPSICAVFAHYMLFHIGKTCVERRLWDESCTWRGFIDPQYLMSFWWHGRCETFRNGDQRMKIVDLVIIVKRAK